MTILIKKIIGKKFLQKQLENYFQSKLQEKVTLSFFSQELKKKVVQLEKTRNNSKVTINKLSQQLEITKKNCKGKAEEFKKKCHEIDEFHILTSETKEFNQSLNKK